MLDELIVKVIEETVLATIKRLGTGSNKENNAMNTKELAEYLNMSQAWVYKNGEIPCKKIGKRKVYFKGDVDAWLQQNTNNIVKTSRVLIKGNSCKKVF